MREEKHQPLLGSFLAACMDVESVLKDESRLGSKALPKDLHVYHCMS